MAEPSPREVLNHLIETCKDGERGFRHAAGLVGNWSMKSVFTHVANRRAQFAADLLPHAQRLGGSAATDGTAAASVHRRWMDVRSTLWGHDDHSILAEARRGDSVTVLAFKTAVDGALPATVRDLVERQYAEVSAAHDELDQSQLKDT